MSEEPERSVDAAMKGRCLVRWPDLLTEMQTSSRFPRFRFSVSEVRSNRTEFGAAGRQVAETIAESRHMGHESASGTMPI